MIRSKQLALILTTLLLAASALIAQESTPSPEPQNVAPNYTPKFKGDPARSDSEFAALAYMRVVIRAEARFNKQYGHYALNLNQLVHSGSFMKRMVNPDRGDYTVSYKGKNEGYKLTMTPKSPDPQHRYFYADEDGKIRAEEGKPAGPESEVLR